MTRLTAIGKSGLAAWGFGLGAYFSYVVVWKLFPLASCLLPLAAVLVFAGVVNIICNCANTDQ